MNKNIAIYPGTFDPITLGHEEIILRAAPLFKKFIVAIAKAHHKQTLFTLEERIELIKQVINRKKLIDVDVVAFDGLLVDLCQQYNAGIIVRGLRNHIDFEYEKQLEQINKKFNADIDTLYLCSSERSSMISSTIVREAAKLSGNISFLVSEEISKALKDKLQ